MFSNLKDTELFKNIDFNNTEKNLYNEISTQLYKYNLLLEIKKYINNNVFLKSSFVKILNFVLYNKPFLISYKNKIYLIKEIKFPSLKDNEFKNGIMKSRNFISNDYSNPCVVLENSLLQLNKVRFLSNNEIDEFKN